MRSWHDYSKKQRAFLLQSYYTYQMHTGTHDSDDEDVA